MVDQTGQEQLLTPGFLHQTHGFDPVGGIVVIVELFQGEVRAIMQFYIYSVSGFVIHVDFFVIGNKIDLLQGLVVVFDKVITLGRALVIVEGHTGADHVNHGGALV